VPVASPATATTLRRRFAFPYNRSEVASDLGTAPLVNPAAGIRVTLPPLGSVELTPEMRKASRCIVTDPFLIRSMSYPDPSAGDICRISSGVSSASGAGRLPRVVSDVRV
jgi:hypothetical protein